MPHEPEVRCHVYPAWLQRVSAMPERELADRVEYEVYVSRPREVLPWAHRLDMLDLPVSLRVHRLWLTTLGFGL